MCGGGTGSANDSSNDDKEGSGNSFKETLANIFTPGDGFKYVDGRLTATRNRDSYAPPVSSNDDSGVNNVQVYDQSGNTFNVRSDATKKYNQRLAGGLAGALTGGIPGMIGGAAINAVTRGRTGQNILDTAGEVTGAVTGSGLKGLFAAPEFANEAEEKAYREKQRERRDAMMASMMSNKSDDGPEFAPAAPKVPTVPTVGGPSSGMSDAAAGGAFRAIPNPNYDPTDPMSPRYLSNPTYDQLLAFRDTGQVIGMAEGGEVMGGNEKTMIADAVSAVKGEMSEEQAAIVLGKFLGSYGEAALRDLVDKVQSGELDDTVDRFAAGEAGAVRGPGDGSGVDDKVPATLEGQQDVLLADGEFVLRKKTADALEKKYGGGFLDAVNEAETDAPRTMREYMAKRA